MNLNTITEVRCVNGDKDFDWREGDSWLAGGTWLFSEPQPHLRRLLDLQGFSWEPLAVSEQGLQISPTCTIARLEALEAPPEWTAAPLIRQCCHSFLASFKVWNTATVGGNICMSLPAGPMISLTVALEGVYTLRLRDGGEHRVAAEEFFTGNNQNILHPGDLLRSIELLHRGYGLHAHKVRDDCYSTSRLGATSASFVLGVFRELRMYGVLGSWGA